MENLGVNTVQLRERHWRIFSLSGTLETVRGRGVVGQEPILSQRQPAFQYSSHVSLQAPSGHMWLVIVNCLHEILNQIIFYCIDEILFRYQTAINIPVYLYFVACLSNFRQLFNI